jgi:DHA1 family bicyclomycin/chloramphenicol resistance-like MFS transporter
VAKPNSPLSDYKYIFYAFAGLVAVAPLATDTYLPAFPSLAEYLGVSIATIQYTIVVFMLGSTLGQFLGGPLSDSIGRLRVALIGCILFSLASLAIASTVDLQLLLWARAAQGFSAGAAGVVVSAIISENYSGKESARIMSTVTLVIMGVPLVAPLIGTFLLKMGDWHSIFYFLAAYGAVVGSIVWANTPKKRLRPVSKARRNIVTGLKQMLTNYRAVLAKPIGRLYLVAMGLNVTVYMIFATSASFVYMSYLGASLEMFPFLIGANTISLIIGNRFGVYLLRHYEPYRVCMIGSCILAFLCLLLLLAVTFLEPTLYLIVGLIIVAAGAIPISGPIASSVFMQLYDKNAGTASASMGIARVAIGMLGGLVVTIAHNGTLYPMAILMFIVSVFGAFCFYSAGKKLSLIQQTA